VASWEEHLGHGKLVAAALNEGGTYNVDPLHMAYALLNAEVLAGVATWAKCPNCGDPYNRAQEGSNETTCSQECWDSYLAYVTQEARG